MALARELNDLYAQGYSCGYQGAGFYAAARYEEGLEQLSEAIELLNRAGDLWEYHLAPLHKACCHYGLGQLPEAVAEARETFASSARFGDMRTYCSSWLWARPRAGPAVRGDPGLLPDPAGRHPLHGPRAARRGPVAPVETARGRPSRSSSGRPRWSDVVLRQRPLHPGHPDAGSGAAAARRGDRGRGRVRPPSSAGATPTGPMGHPVLLALPRDLSPGAPGAFPEPGRPGPVPEGASLRGTELRLRRIQRLRMNSRSPPSSGHRSPGSWGGFGADEQAREAQAILEMIER